MLIVICKIFSLYFHTTLFAKHHKQQVCPKGLYLNIVLFYVKTLLLAITHLLHLFYFFVISFFPINSACFFFVLKPYLSFTFMFSVIFIIYIFYVFSTHTTTSLLIPHLFKNKRLRLRKYKERKTKYTNLHKYKTREEIFQIDCLCCSSNNNIYNKNNKKHFLVYHTYMYVCVVYTAM